MGVHVHDPPVKFSVHSVRLGSHHPVEPTKVFSHRAQTENLFVHVLGVLLKLAREWISDFAHPVLNTVARREVHTGTGGRTIAGLMGDLLSCRHEIEGNDLVPQVLLLEVRLAQHHLDRRVLHQLLDDLEREAAK